MLAQVHGARIALRGPAEELSYSGLAAAKNAVAGWAFRNRVQPGDVVCLFMLNDEMFPAFWAGLLQAGAVVALINTSLRQDGLVQAVGAANPAHVIAGADLLHHLLAVADRLPQGLARWMAGSGGGLPAGVARVSLDDEPAASARPMRTMRDTALLIYTSGTTGWPKPARITHYRVLEWSLWFAGIMNMGPDDRLYDCLPMYHSTGGVAALGGTLLTGGCAVIRDRFSAGRFWQDMSDERCSIFLYIGELCRYLLAAPDIHEPQSHSLRLACGNGLGPDIWQRFRDRFQIPQIVEFYASTEGNVSLYNLEGKTGSVGRVPGFLQHRFPVALVRCDTETEGLVRDDQGLCTRCLPDEPGEAIGRISEDAASPASFDGYTGAAATEDKIIRNVFEQGDAWFRTGDLMRQDAAGFFYFLDRLGDTFRWKGQNVSTTQVAQALSGAPLVTLAVCYGVAVRDCDGKAGMAAIAVANGFDIGALYAHLRTVLPDYAIPLFIRIRPTLETTGTYKLVKNSLAREGYACTACTDALYRLDARSHAYIVISKDVPAESCRQAPELPAYSALPALNNRQVRAKVDESAGGGSIRLWRRSAEVLGTDPLIGHDEAP